MNADKGSGAAHSTAVSYIVARLVSPRPSNHSAICIYILDHIIYPYILHIQHVSAGGFSA